MRNEMKIYIQKPWKYADSPYYKFLVENPPKNIKYVNMNEFGLIYNKNKLKINNWVKQTGKKFIKFFFSSLPNAHFSRNSKKYDLIHAAHCLSLNKHIPWVADIEYYGQFFMSTPYKNFPSKKWIKKILLRNNCKKILPWSQWSKKNILENFPELKNKIEIVYPAIPSKRFSKKPSNKIRLLFVGRDFYLKGGNIAVQIIDTLSKGKENVEGVVVSDTPREILKKYNGNKNIKFYDLMPQSKLFNEIYPSCDIFLYPTFSDTFGFAILEAQSFGLPVIAQKTNSTHTIDETVEHGKTGFIVRNSKEKSMLPLKYLSKYEKSVLPKMIKYTSNLINDSILLKKMSKECIKVISNGKFSIKKRKEKLIKIYEEAIV